MDVPDPLATSTVLTSDLELLQQVADAAVVDAAELAEHLGLPCPASTAPREHFYKVLLPRVDALLHTQKMVTEAEGELRTRAAQLGNKRIDVNGVTGLLVGRRDPALAGAVLPLTRRERRDAERRR